MGPNPTAYGRATLKGLAEPIDLPSERGPVGRPAHNELVSLISLSFVIGNLSFVLREELCVGNINIDQCIQRINWKPLCQSTSPELGKRVAVFSNAVCWLAARR